MWKEKLQEIKKLNEMFGEEINDGATEEEIKIFLQAINDDNIEKILQPYLAFLENVNGLEFNGYILYGIDSQFLSNEPKQQINGFMDNNEVWKENEWEKEYLFLGDSSISWYVYDVEAGKYNELDKPSGDVVETYDSLEMLLDKVLGDAIA